MLQTLNTLTRSVEYVSTRNSYRMAILSPYELDRIAHRHGAGAHDVAVERQAPVELQLDPAQHADVLLKRIGVERRHDAALPQIPHADDHVTDLELPALPRALRQPLDAGDDDVRAEPPPIGAERPDRAVGRDEEREHVESLHPVVAHQPRARPHCGDDVVRDLRSPPRPPVDQRLPVRAQGRAVAEQPRSRARRDDTPVRATHVYNAVTYDPVGADLRPGQALGRHRLHWIAPQLSDVHRSSRPATPQTGAPKRAAPAGGC